MTNNLTFAKLKETNTARCENNWHKIDSWSLPDWGVALAGEAGEMCNIIKKINRFRDGIGHMNKESQEELSIALGEEIADIVIYCDLLATRAGFSLEELVRTKFNQDSTKRNVVERL